jgi:hypothetical protein
VTVITTSWCLLLTYCHELGMWLLDGIWIGWSDSSTPYTYHSELQAAAAQLLSSALHTWLLHTLLFSVYYSLHYPFPGNGFYHWNWITYHGTTAHLKTSSSLQNFQLWTELSRFLRYLPTANPVLCCNCQLSYCCLFSVIFDCRF